MAVVTKKNTKEDALPSPVQSIHPGVVSLLQELELKATLEGSTRSLFDTIYINGIKSPLSPVENEVWHGHHIDRNCWDRSLLQHLGSLSLKLYSDVGINKVTRASDGSIEVTTNHEITLKCKYLIDASGARRITRHFLKLNEVFLTRPMTCWTGRSYCNDQHDLPTSFSMNKSGWTWLAPEDEHHITWNQLKLDTGTEFNDPHSVFKPIGKPFAYNVRWRVFRPICDQQVLLCGDAAGMLDPAAGQGILNALLSGIKAGQCLIACIAAPEQEPWHFALYDQWFITQYEQKVADLTKYYQDAGIDRVINHRENTVKS